MKTDETHLVLLLEVLNVSVVHCQLFCDARKLAKVTCEKGMRQPEAGLADHRRRRIEEVCTVTICQVLQVIAGFNRQGVAWFKRCASDALRSHRLLSAVCLQKPCWRLPGCRESAKCTFAANRLRTPFATHSWMCSDARGSRCRDRDQQKSEDALTHHFAQRHGVGAESRGETLIRKNVGAESRCESRGETLIRKGTVEERTFQSR